MAPSNRASRPTCSSSPATRSTRPAGCAARSSTGGPAMRIEKNCKLQIANCKLQNRNTAFYPVMIVVIALSSLGIASAQDKKPAAAKAPSVAIVGADIYTITKGVIKNGTILIQDGKIVRVGTDISIPDGAIRID